jgi:hypothetical protein
VTLKLTPEQVSNLAAFLKEVSETSRTHGVRFCAHERNTLEVGVGAYVNVGWDHQALEYVVDHDGY